jgi:hypothetical protein
MERMGEIEGLCPDVPILAGANRNADIADWR